MKQTGIMLGHFEPLHLGHIRTILHAAGQVEHLHLIITSHPNPNPKYPVTLQDKARWLQMACSDFPFVHVHILDETLLPANNNQAFDGVNINLPLSNAKLVHAVSQAGLDISAPKNSPKSPILFVAENHPAAHLDTINELALTIHTTPVYPEFNSFAIQQDPIKHWDVIHPEARGSYTKTVAIVGGESSGKTTLVHKLANHYGANLALEMGRLYVHTDLGGTEVGLQYSDYTPIALDHAQAIRDAVYQAKAPVTIIDTDFVTTQAFCEEYEGRTHPFVTACIEEFKLDHTIMLDNNTPWVDDGMRSLGDNHSRSRFENRLIDIFNRHKITPHHIMDEDYHQRYLSVIKYINQVIYNA